MGEYLLKSLNRKARNLPQAPGKGKAKERLLLACDVGYFIYEDERFNELRLAILNDVSLIGLEGEDSDDEMEGEMSDDSEAVKYAKRGQLTGGASNTQTPFNQNSSGYPLSGSAPSIPGLLGKSKAPLLSPRWFYYLFSEIRRDIKSASPSKAALFYSSIIGSVAILLLCLSYQLINVPTMLGILLLEILAPVFIYAYSRKEPYPEKAENKGIEP